MKKKLIQILMLSVIAVSVGSLVSCKDTNEDLYNELHAQTAQALADQNATLQNALDQWKAALEDQIAKYNALKDQLENMSQCECVDYTDKINSMSDDIEDIKARIADEGDGLGCKIILIDGRVVVLEDKVSVLENQINDNFTTLKGLIDALTAQLETLKDDEQANANEIAKLTIVINGLKDQLQAHETMLDALKDADEALRGQVTDNATAIALLQQTVANLKEQLDKVKSCECDYAKVIETLATLQTEVTNAQNTADQALQLAQGANTTAEVAKTIAETAKTNADAALTTAQQLVELVNQSNSTANEAKTLAEQANNNAVQALSTANAANSLATQLATQLAALEGRVQTNEAAISELRTNAEAIKTLIATTKSDLLQTIGQEKADLLQQISKNATDIATNAANIGENARNIAAAQNDIIALDNRISTLETNYTVLNGQVTQALSDASLALALARANENRIIALEASVSSLESTKDDHERRILALESTVSGLGSSIQSLDQALNGRIDLLEQALNGKLDAADIEELKTAIALLTKAAADCKTSIEELSDRVCCLQTQVGILEGALAIEVAANATHYEMAKKYADEQIAALEIALRQYINDLLIDYMVNNPDIDLSNYVTQAELQAALQNYATTGQLNTLSSDLNNKINNLNTDLNNKINDTNTNLNNKINDLSTDLNNKINTLGADLTNAEAALRLAIDNLTQEVVLKGLTIDDLVTKVNDLYSKYNDLSGKYNDLSGKYNNLDGRVDGLDGKYNDLDGKYNDLDGRVDGLDDKYNDLSDKYDNLDGKYDDLLAAYNDLLSKYGELNGQVGQNKSDIEWLKYFLNQLTGRVDGIASDMGNLDSRFITREEFNSWKDAVLEAILNAGDDNGHNTIQIPIIVTTVVEKVYETLNGKVREQLEELLKDEDFMKQFGFLTIDDLDGYLKEGDLDGYLKADDPLILALIADVEALKGQEDYGDRIKALEDLLKGSDGVIGSRLTDIEGVTGDHEARIKKLEEDILKLFDEYVTKDALDALKAIMATKDDIKDFITEDNVKNLLKEYAPLSDFNDLKNNFNTFKTDVLDRLDKNDAKVDGIKTTVDDLVNTEIPAMKTDIANLQTAVGENTTKINNLQDAVNTITSDVNALKDKVANIQNQLAKQVTGIIIQGTKNPMFGTFSIPTNVQSNVLVAYYGVPESDGEFPTYKTGLYGIRADQALTTDEIAKLKEQGLKQFKFNAGEPLLNGEDEGTAGKIYMTINPNTADLEGLQLSIVNTLDEESPIQLKPIQKSNDKLQFGFTRANNGFYEAEAYIDINDLDKDNGIPVTREDVEKSFNEVRHTLSDIAEEYRTTGSIQLGDLATKVYQTISTLKMDKSGLKCTYTTKDTEGVETEHSVYSQYNLGATFINPLNLDTAKDLNFVTMIGYEAIEEILNKMAKTLKDHIDVLFKDAINTPQLQNLINNFVLDELEFVNMTNNYIAHFNARVSKITLNGNDYKLTLPGSGSFAVMFDKNLKAGGAPVSIPDAVKFDADKMTNVVRATLVIGGDLNSDVTTMIIVPASGEDGVIGAYATIQLTPESVSVANAGGVIVVTTPDGSTNVATFTGGSIDTSGYAATVHLRNVVGGNGELNLPVVLEVTEDIQKLLEQQKTTMDKVVAELNKIIKRINDYNGIVDGWVDDFIDDYLRKYLDEINNGVVGFFNAINRRFGPFMAASDSSKGLKRMSRIKDMPTIMKKEELVFYPTTKTLELIVPLSRKHVAVTNVFKGSATAYDDADCLAKMKAVNSGEDFNKVVDGTVRKLNVTGMVPGYVYEIAYSILDFDGLMSTKKYYVEVK